MKHIFTVLLIACGCYLPSCNKDDNTSGTYVIPKSDSVTKGGYMQLSFAGKSFMIHDLIVQKAPIYTLYGRFMASDVNDTLWIGQMQLTDHESKTLGINLTMYNNISGTAIGTYMITTNSSTVTDYSEGENKVYAVSIGSFVDVTNTDYTTEGSFSLTLYFNHVAYPATGSFKFYN